MIATSRADMTAQEQEMHRQQVLIGNLLKKHQGEVTNAENRQRWQEVSSEWQSYFSQSRGFLPSTEETTASAQQIAASAQELAKTGEGLQSLVAQFKTA